MGEINYAPLIDDMVWSYSRIKAFVDCPYRFYLKYIRHIHGKEMFFASYGTFMHKLIETYFKEGKSPRQLTDIYLRDFKKEVVGRAPNKTVFGNYFTGGLEYLRGIHPFPYRPAAIEKKVDFKVNGIPFIGYIDFLGELDGSLYVVDNKSRVLKPRSKREKPTKTDEELDAYLRQLYLYSAAVEEEYGVRPHKLCFNCFRTDKLLVNNVMDAAFRRDTYQQLKECQKLCTQPSAENIEQKIYKMLDDVMMEFSTTNDVPAYKDVVDKCWEEIKGRQGAGYAGIPFKFPALNDYATIERGELFIFGAEQKQGKSMMLLNCAVDLLKQDYAVLYLDSELNTRLFTSRILAHLSGIEYKRLTSGNYSEEEEQRILAAKEWLKTRKFTHIYIPMFDQQSIYTAVNKVKHTQGLDVLIVDYFKGKGEGDAFDSYQELGRFVDMVKNQICGEMNIAGIGAAQATITGKLADSAKIARNASTIAMISDKTPEEIEADGAECGNKKLRVTVNRNGMQMTQDEYIDLLFDGNHILYEQAKQHIPQTPF